MSYASPKHSWKLGVMDAEQQEMEERKRRNSKLSFQFVIMNNLRAMGTQINTFQILIISHRPWGMQCYVFHWLRLHAANN